MSEHPDDTDDTDDPRTPDGEEATEQCPICSRWNNPGACDACGHFLACCWDGEIIWNTTFDRFSQSWSGLGGDVATILESDPGAAEGILKELGITHRMPDGWLDEVERELSATEFFESHNDLEFGETFETDGMLSGSGYSLYHKNPGEVEEFMGRVIRIAADLKGHLPDDADE